MQQIIAFNDEDQHIGKRTEKRSRCCVKRSFRVVRVVVAVHHLLVQADVSNEHGCAFLFHAHVFKMELDGLCVTVFDVVYYDDRHDDPFCCPLGIDFCYD